MKTAPPGANNDSAAMESGSTIDPLARIIGEVCLGPTAQIGAGAVLEGPIIAGACLRAAPLALVGGPAQHRRPEMQGTLHIGSNVEIREAATVHRGCAKPDARTVIGDDVLIMAYAHVGHDCRLERGVTLCNGAQLGGHVVVGEYAMVGARAALHQFVRVGSGAMIAAGSMVSGDVPPWTLVAGDRARIIGPNRAALVNHGLKQSLPHLRKAIRLLWPGSGRAAIPAIELKAALGTAEAKEDPVIESLIAFLTAPTKRSCCARQRH